MTKNTYNQLQKWRIFIDMIKPTLLLLLLSSLSKAECIWSSSSEIANDASLYYRTCDQGKMLEISGVVLPPKIEFYLPTPECPECNSLWAKKSPDGQTVLVWVENNSYKRNAWIIDMPSHSVKLFSEDSFGKHYLPEFVSNTELLVKHAGMGYRTDLIYKKTGQSWSLVSKKDIEVEY